MYETTRIMLLSDIHVCHQSWYGTTNEEQLEDLMKAVTAAKGKNDYALSLVLGDVSLDFWGWHQGGSYLWEPKVSRTAEFVERYMPSLPRPSYIIPGNHEQYGHNDWRRITGGERQQCVTAGGALFVLLDSFSGDLDPSENSDGTYVPVDVAYIRRAMADKPELPVFLCAHYFDFALESAEFKALLAEEKRIKALFMGHDHMTNVSFTPEDAGRLPILRTGHFSYSCDDTDYATAYRGWRELLLHPDGSFESYYFIPRQYIPARDTYTGEHIRDEYTYRSR